MELTSTINTEEMEKRIVKGAINAIKSEIKNIIQKEEIFTVKALAKYLEVSEQWVYERVQENEIPYIKLGEKLIRFRKSAIDHYLKNHESPAICPPGKVIKLPQRQIRAQKAC